MTGDWLFFTGKEVTVRQIANVLGDCEMEIWDDAGVLEIPLGDKASMDFEAVSLHPKDEVTRAFAAEHGTEQVFLVTFPPEYYERAEALMKRILSEFPGLFCGDTEDLQPRLEK